MKWKSLIVLLIVILMVSGCAEKAKESGSDGSVQASGIGVQDTQEKDNSEGNSATGKFIDSVVFSRTGALLTLKSEAEISEIRVYSDNEQIASLEIRKTED